jgi:hypothetical protein
MAHIQTGDCICYRKGGPTYRVRSVLADGRLLVGKESGGTKILTRPEEFVHVAECKKSGGCPFLVRATDVMVPRVLEA